MKYKSSFDTTVLVISALIIFFAIYFLKRELVTFDDSKGNFLILISNLKFTILLLVCLLVSFSLSIKYYRIDQSAIIIKRRLYKKVIELKDVESIERKYALDAYIRIFGIGGLFGYNGIFLTTNWKIVYLYTNHRNNLIRINRRHAPPVYISPDDADAFVAECKERGLMLLEA